MEPFTDFPDKIDYQVVINHEEQYSLWPRDMRPPSGWKPVGKKGKKKDCVNYIEEVWTDMRPLRFHKEMAAEISRLR